MLVTGGGCSARAAQRLLLKRDGGDARGRPAVPSAPSSPAPRGRAEPKPAPAWEPWARREKLSESVARGPGRREGRGPPWGWREGKAAGRAGGSPIRAGAGSACVESSLKARPERAAQPERRPRYLRSAAARRGAAGRPAVSAAGCSVPVPAAYRGARRAFRVPSPRRKVAVRGSALINVAIGFGCVTLGALPSRPRCYCCKLIGGGRGWFYFCSLLGIDTVVKT